MPNKKIDKIIYEIIAREGGYSDHKADRGGPTKYGVTLATLSSYLGRPATKDDVKALTKHTAFEILYRFYYEVPDIDMLPESIQPIMADMSVNHGPRKSISMLQDVLTTCALNVGPIDGHCGQRTQSAARKCWDDIGNDLINKLVNRRIALYHNIVKDDPSQLKFISGWVNRAELFLV